MPTGYEIPTQPPLGDELGSSFGFSFESLFSGFEDGLVFSYEDPILQDYREMLETDGKAAGVEKMLTFPIIAAPWEITPAKDDRGEAEFVNRVLKKTRHEGGMELPIDNIISQMTAAVTYKRTYFEKVFKVNDDNEVVYDKIAWRPFETCELALDAEHAEFRGFRQRPWYFTSNDIRELGKNGWIMIPRERAFVYIHGVWRDPLIGMSSMQVPYWCYVTKRKIRYLWYQYLETTSLPKTIAKHNDPDIRKDAARKIATLKSRGVLGLDADVDVETLESSGKGADQFIEAMRFLDSEMSQSILAGFMDLTSSAAEGKGSYALSRDQSALYLRTRRVVAKDMARQITDQLIAPLVYFNFGHRAACPRFTFGPLNEASEEMVLDVFKQVMTSGQAVPVEFYDQLVARVASMLELDSDKVADRLASEKPHPLEKMAETVDKATSMVANHQQQQQQAKGGGGSGEPQQRNASGHTQSAG